MNRKLTAWCGCALWIFWLAALALIPVHAQDLAVPGYPAARAVPGAKELPDPAQTYKVVFDIAKAAPSPSQVNPGLVGVTRFVNTLSAYGVPASHRKIAIVIHQGAAPMVLDDQAYAAEFNGAHNPNIALIQALSKAGVAFHVCGQGVMARRIDPKTIQPQIQLDLWALTTMVDLETQGYVHFSE